MVTCINHEQIVKELTQVRTEVTAIKDTQGAQRMDTKEIFGKLEQIEKKLFAWGLYLSFGVAVLSWVVSHADTLKDFFQ